MFNKYKPLNLYSNFAEAAEKFPTQDIYFDESLTAFPELQLHTTYLEAKDALITKASQIHTLGVKKGEKVIIYKSAKFDTYLLAVAVSYLGAVPIMISPHLPAETMDILVSRLDNPWMIFDGDTAHKAQILQNMSKQKLIAVEEILATAFEQPCAQDKLPLDTISYMTHTSGTTGVPKLIAHSANSMGWRTKWQKNILSLIRKRGLVAFHISPVHSRFNIGISSLMAKGFPLLPIANPSRENVTKVLMDYEPMVLETHPNHFVQWASLARDKPEVFQSLKYYHSTFDAINKETMATFLRCSKHGKPVFLQVYGQSECGPMIMRFHTKSSLKNTNARAMGIGMPRLTKARIVDQNGKPVKAGVSGNIQMFSKGRALTYYKETPRFEENVYGAWWDSGDYGVKSRFGVLSLLDRQVDLVDKIESTLAIEDAILDELTFLDEVVIIRGENGSPQPIIAVNESKEMNWDLWWKKVSDMPHLNEPIIMKYEEMPRTATMKIQRLELERSLQQN
ncbi:acyl-CoA synthetase [Listeria booriae]|uniref:Acyl-CoA synthetase n=1 Tax=Listeria booriae TaxID=1552123 RepID=A0A841Y2B6_9LIST|nr:acyl-CoA synthetase [Listeria booriae]MBC1371463.1 acyl-CoA synthetase [Listeria booriae]